MLAPGCDPLRMKPVEIRDVKCVDREPTLRGVTQLFLVGVLDEAGVQGSQHDNTASAKHRDKVAIHRVLVKVDLDLAHRHCRENRGCRCH